MLPRPAALSIPFAVACLGLACFSAMDTVMKQLAIAIGSYNAMLWRTLLSLVVLVPVYLLRGGGWPERRVLALHAVRGSSLALSLVLFFWGLARVPMALGVALTFIAPLIALGLAAFFLKERIGRATALASLIAFLGVFVILWGQPTGAPGTGDWQAPAAILVAAFFYAVGTVMSRPLAQRASPLEMALFFNLVACGLCGLFAPWYAILPGGPQILPLIAAVIASNLSMMLLAWAYARAEAQQLLPVEYTAFVWAMIYGWLIFGETVTVATLGGAVLIVAACLWAARSGAPAAPPAARAALEP